MTLSIATLGVLFFGWVNTLAAQGYPPGVYEYFQVDRPAQMKPGMHGAEYPAMLRAVHVDGEVVVGFIVDTLGRVEPGRFDVYRSTHKLFTDAVRKSLPNLRFSPAIRRGQRVSQLVVCEFDFSGDSTSVQLAQPRTNGFRL